MGLARNARYDILPQQVRLVQTEAGGHGAERREGRTMLLASFSIRTIRVRKIGINIPLESPCNCNYISRKPNYSSCSGPKLKNRKPFFGKFLSSKEPYSSYEGPYILGSRIQGRPNHWHT